VTDPPPSGGGRFQTTRWSIVVAAAGEEGAPAEREALESLCGAYWYPLYAFARRRGSDAHEAQDHVQGFFSVLLEKGYLRDADRERGRFRTFLIAAFRHFVSKEREKARALKRGGGRKRLSLDFERGEERYSLEPADDRTPEVVFERRWALTLLDRVLELLREEHRAAGRLDLFDALSPFLAGGSPLPTHRAAGEALGMSEGAVKVAVHRLRRKYRDTLRAEIARTVADPADVDAEIRHLMEALAG